MRWRAIAGMVLLGAVLVVARVLWSSREEWRVGDSALAAKDEVMAIDHFGRAARLYAPGNPWCERSLERLEEIARNAETGGQRERALSAWREERSAILGTRAIYTPHGERLAVADQEIARLAAALEPSTLELGSNEAARRRWHADRLARSNEPRIGWTLVALLGFFSWVAASLGFLALSVDERSLFHSRSAIRWGLGIAVGLLMFLLGLARA